MSGEIDPLSLLIINLANAVVRWIGILLTLWLTLWYLDPWVLALLERQA